MNTSRAFKMAQMHESGMTQQQIADVYGISRAAVSQTIQRINHKKTRKIRGRALDIERIKYKHIYEYFKSHVDETASSFADKVFGYAAGGGCMKMLNFLYGQHEVHFTIDQMRMLCETVGKSFEEIFEGR
jgi:predicted transcriptional regulator